MSEKLRILALEPWGIGDVAMAIPFLRTASDHGDVTLVARPHAAPLLRRFAPRVRHVEALLPWTDFTHKYDLPRWPWRALHRLRRELRAERFDLVVSARPDPRDHVLMALSGARRRLGFARAGSRPLLTTALPPPPSPHRAAYWAALAHELSWDPAPPLQPKLKIQNPKSVAVVHTGAGQALRQWPRQRYGEIIGRLRAAGWSAHFLDDDYESLDVLMDAIASADLFIGNDSGPGHLAALLDVPTFTIFGPQVPEAFHPVHPAARWIEGTACPNKPCFDTCRFARPYCIQDLTTDDVWAALQPSLRARLS